MQSLYGCKSTPKEALLLQEPRLLMGLQTSHLGAITVIKSHAVEAGPKRDVSLHIIIPSVGEGISLQELPNIYGRAGRHHQFRSMPNHILTGLQRSCSALTEVA